VPWSVLVSGVARGGKGKGTSSSGLRSVNFGWTDISKVSDTEKCLLPISLSAVQKAPPFRVVV
jgi:hypothetical protein